LKGGFWLMTSNTGQTTLEQLEQIVDEHKGSGLAEIPVPQKLMEQVLNSTLALLVQFGFGYSWYLFVILNHSNHGHSCLQIIRK